MTMNDDQYTSESEFPDELISAYLDGELSAEEKSRVEEQLMDSAAHRHLFEELKSLRQSLQSLPAQSLDDDFAARVLRRAEQQLLTGGPEEALASGGPEEGDALAGGGAKSQPVFKKSTNSVGAASVHGGVLAQDRGAWRGLFWSVAAMAAAILLIVASPIVRENTQPHNRGVAVNKANAENESPSREHESVRDNNTVLGVQQRGGNSSQLAADGAANGGARNFAVQPSNEKLGAERASEYADKDAAKNDASARNGVEGGQATADKYVPEKGEREQLQGGQFGGGDVGATPARIGQSGSSQSDRRQVGRAEASGRAPLVGNVAGGSGGSPAQGGGFGIAAQNTHAPTINAPHANLPNADAASGEAFQYNQLAANVGKFKQLQQDLKKRARLVDGGDLFSSTAGGKSLDEVAWDRSVVTVDLTRAALAGHFMDDLLQKHKIHTEVARANLPYENESQRERKANAAFAQTADEQGERQTRAQQQAGQQPAQVEEKLDEARRTPDELGDVPRNADQQREELLARDFRERNKNARGEKKALGDVELMVVVATPRQISALLRDMQSQRGDVLAMASDIPALTAPEVALRGAARSSNQTAPAIRSVAPPAPTQPAAAAARPDAAGNSSDTGANSREDAALKGDAKDRAELTAESDGEPLFRRDATNRTRAEAKRAGEDNSVDADAIDEEAIDEDDAEQFRGIARRLQLPEDFQQLITPPPLKEKALQAGAATAGPAAEGSQRQGGGQGAPRGGLAFDDADAAQRLRKAETESAPARGQPLVRVLFVLRAANGAAAPALADQRPADETSAAEAPSAAALEEPAASKPAAAPAPKDDK